MQSHIGSRCEIIPLPEWALLALQGPLAVAALARLAPDVAKLRFMTGGAFKLHTGQHRIPVFLTRSGYTGEDGFEISVHSSQAEALARALLAQPEVQPIGLGARNSLRLEAGLCLYGNDMDRNTNPVEANLLWAMQKVRRTGGTRAGGFPGAARLLAQMEAPMDAPTAPAKRRVGLVALERIPVREHTPLHHPLNGQPVGMVTSGLLGPTVDRPIAMGYVPAALAAVGTRLNAMVRGKPVPMEVAPMPFTPHRYWRG